MTSPLKNDADWWTGDLGYYVDNLRAPQQLETFRCFCVSLKPSADGSSWLVEKVPTPHAEVVGPRKSKVMWGDLVVANSD